MRQATLLFLVTTHDICLAMKKRGFGAGRWNGTGGKVHEGESIEAALVREAVEELGITPRTYEKVAALSFTFPHEPSFDQIVHVYLGHTWDGEPRESEEMRPQWFPIDAIPYDTMWSDDILWLPHVLKGERVQGAFTFSKDDAVVAHEVAFVPHLS